MSRPNLLYPKKKILTPRLSSGSIQSTPTDSLTRNRKLIETYRFTEQQMKAVQISHKVPEDFGDKIALNAVRFLRYCMDKVTGYKHPEEANSSDPKAAAKVLMTERQWLIRMIFLESIAAVPGMVGGMLRHLHSLRRMKRDNGWVGNISPQRVDPREKVLI
jgi:hypothetical protein